MRRGVALFVVGSGVLVTLAGCGRGWLSFEERDPWRREAEVACIKSGSVKQTGGVTLSKAIEGPGICGAEYPFRVAALGESPALGYSDVFRPPAAISPPFAGTRYPERSYPQGQAAAAGRPVSISPVAADSEDEEEEANFPTTDPYAVPGGRPPTPTITQRQQNQYPARPDYGRSAQPSALPPLGPVREPPALGSLVTAIAPTATLACPMVSALDSWMAASVQPAAQKWFGQPVVEIKQISAYSCRGMNGQRGAQISEHAFGNALDIAAFTLADGRRVTVKDGWRGEPEEQGFLRDVHAAACEQFSTVLAPGSNRFHYDHIHVDLARRRTGRSVCNPAAVPGDLIAQRRGDTIVTGSTGRGGRYAHRRADDKLGELIEKLPRAIPGAD
jgi:hypothetical protein